MPTIKIYPPSQLPDRNVSETEFTIWKEELEVYLSQEDSFQQFLEDGKYNTWKKEEEARNGNRITELEPEDGQDANGDALAPEVIDRLLKQKNRNLRTFLSIIGKCVSQGHYSSVVKHSQSFTHICSNLRRDYDIQKKGIHFFNILELKYDEEKMTPINFYNQYRTIICNNLGKSGDIIKYDGNTTLLVDEKMTPMLEDLVLLNAVDVIDHRLPGFLKMHYNHKMKEEDRLMDFKSDIMVNIPKFLDKLDSEQSSSLNAFQLNWKKKGGQGQTKDKIPQKFNPNKNMFCRLCHKCDMPKDVVTSHNLGDMKCSMLSYQDKMKFNASKMANMKDTEEDVIEEESDDDPAVLHGYYTSESQVTGNINNDTYDKQTNFSDAKFGYMEPEPTQILTVFQSPQNLDPVHIDLDSGASLNYTEEREAIKRGFKILPNGQMSKLGDGLTRIKACGELNETFFRNKKKVKWRSVVCKNLTAPFIGGTPFLKDNGIEQDFVKNIIHLHNRSETVQPTNPMAILPTVPTFKAAEVFNVDHLETLPAQPSRSHHDDWTGAGSRAGWGAGEEQLNIKPCTLLNFKSIKVLLPGQVTREQVPHPDGSVVAIEPWEQNKLHTWPEPHLSTIREGMVELVNNTTEPINLGADVKTCKIWTTEESEEKNQNSTYYKFSKCGSIKNVQT